jgi:NAD(P)-dependent dehydrogenase (short-subunit alcohol dehydrogenase family)
MADNKVALVTGVSSGIGRETAQLLAGRGFQVFGTMRGLRTAATSAGLERIRLDVTDQAAVAKAVQYVIEKAGRIHALVNNAGYAQKIANGASPRAVAEVVYRALTAHSPRLRYPVGGGVGLTRLRRFLPAGMFDKGFRKQFHLSRV